jgi:hypothetical protein
MNHYAMSNCINLRHRYGSRYKVFNEVEGRPARTRDDEGELIIPGRRGFVAVWGQGLLVACTHATATTRRLLEKVPGAVVKQDGSDGQNVIFAPEHLETVAAILKLRRKKQYTPAQRQAAAAQLAKVRPKTLSGGSVSPQIPPISPPAGENPA